MTPQNRQNEQIFIFVHLSTFRAENTPKSRPFKVKNNAQTLPKQLRKSPENDFFDPQNGQKLPLKTAKMSQNLTKNLNFLGHL